MRPIEAFKPSPIFRLTIFLAIGIFVSDTIGYSSFWLEILAGAMGVLFLLLLLLYRGRWLSIQGWFGIGVALFFLLFGGWSVQYGWHKRDVTWLQQEMFYRGYLVDSPQEKGNSSRVLVEVDGQSVLLSFPKESDVLDLQVGEELLFYTTIKAPRNAGNPGEFDYARYLLLRGITGTAFVEEGYWQKGSGRREVSLKQRALQMRQKVVDCYRSWGIDDSNLAVLAALTVGEKEDVTAEIRENYASAGLSHLLALSGLHVGVIWGCISFLFRFFGKRFVMRLVRCLLVVTALWLFAFIGGLTPSLIRAVVMCTLLELSLLRRGKVKSIHTLAAAAWIMLLYNPFYLFDVGFQLSFVAVFSILIIFPLLHQTFYNAHRWLRYFLQALSVSLAAQLGTAFLSIYYFSIFPSYFLLSNLAVLLLLPFILFGVLITFLFSFWPSFHLLLVRGVNGALTCLNAIAEGVSHWPYATIQIDRLSCFTLLLAYTLLAWLLFYLYNRNRGINLRKVWISLPAILVIYGAVELYNYQLENHSPYLIFYNQRNCPAIHLVESKRHSWIVTHSPDSLLYKMRYIADSYWKQEGLVPQIVPLCKDSIDANRGLIEWKGRRICVVNDRYWSNKLAAEPLTVDYLYVCKGFSGDISSFNRLFDIGVVVLDGSLSRYHVDRFVSLCDSLQLPCVDLASTGSYKVRF
ncbi:MAG: ComEC/Rec2 family competence protein [Phocaeicola sp.]